MPVRGAVQCEPNRPARATCAYTKSFNCRPGPNSCNFPPSRRKRRLEPKWLRRQVHMVFCCFRHIQYFESESRMQIQRHVAQVSDKHQRRGQVIKWANAPPYTTHGDAAGWGLPSRVSPAPLRKQKYTKNNCVRIP